MVSDQNTQTPNKVIVIVALASILVMVFTVVMYLSLRQDAFAKTLPYTIQVQLNSENSTRMVVYYDYGYGFKIGHHQVFELVNNQQQAINFTISTWKKLKSIRINSDNNASLESVVIKKNGFEYQALKSVMNISKDTIYYLHDIDETLIEASD